MNKSDMLRQLADELDRPATGVKLPSGDITIQEAMRRMRAAWPGRNIKVELVAWDWSFSVPTVYWSCYVDAPGVDNQEAPTLRGVVEKMERIAAERAEKERAAAMPFEQQLALADEVIAGSTDTAVIPAAAMTRTSADEVGDRLVEAL